MSQASEISHLTEMIRGNVYNCFLTNLNTDYGYVCRIEKIIDNGGFAKQATLEAMGLAKAATELRVLAAAIDKARTNLIKNSMEIAA